MISQAVFGILRLIHICSISSYEANKEDCLIFIPASLINQIFVIRSYTILHRLTQLFFTRFVLDLEDSCK